MYKRPRLTYSQETTQEWSQPEVAAARRIKGFVFRKRFAKRRYSRPRNVFMKGNNTTTIRRTLMQSAAINLSTGWTGGVSSGYDICIAPTLINTSFIVAGTTAFQPVVPNVSELVNLFDEYRLKRMHYTFFFSSNSAATNTPANCLPILHIANDYDSAAAFSLSDILQYPEMYTYQLGKEKRISWSMTPRVKSDVLTQGGLLSSSALLSTGWLATSSGSIEYLGTRVYINTQGRTTNVDVGSLTIQVTYDIELRRVK